ncbi:MAG: sarcosine oxidase subunit delta [Rhizobiaceae bacterium]|nr:sarcosine oxidase subunit delta [Rhizobiaceae bacterium]
MQIYPCPFCGPRDETEFFFCGEAGNDRPEPASSISDERWSEYLYTLENPLGASREIWMHLTCNEIFVMERDTLTHVVNGSTQIEREGE